MPARRRPGRGPSGEGGVGRNKAKCAVGRSVLVIIWHLLTDLGPGWHDEQAARERKIRAHLRQLKALGLDVTVNPSAA
jgi:transposase